MNKSYLIALLGLFTFCQVSSGAKNLTKTKAANHSSVEVKCQLVTIPSKILGNIGFKDLSEQSIPGLVGVLSKDQMDGFWKALKGKEGFLVDEFGDVIVKSGEAGNIQKGYDFTYPVDYDASARPIKMGTLFLGTKLEVKPFVTDVTIDLYHEFKVTQLKEITQIYTVKESDLVKKPSLVELVSALPKGTVYNPVLKSRSCDGSVTLYTGQSLFYSMDDYLNTDLGGKVPNQKMKLKDPSKRCFLIITATVIEPQATKH
jgi:hypothetical protein